MNQRALQKAHESNHPAGTREAVRAGGGEESRTGLASDPQPLPPRCRCRPGTGTLRASSPGPRALPSKTGPGQHRAAGGLQQGTAPSCTRGSLGEWGMAEGSAWGEGCGCVGKSPSPFCSVRCPRVRKIRAEATSCVQQVIKMIFCSIMDVQKTRWHKHIHLNPFTMAAAHGTKTPFLSSQLKTRRGQVDNCWGIGSSSFP